ncbi:sulfite exporter TauE/SafE family protein [Novosphingobium sp.]|uniref:sulfite exporter TauE/SafE family protein n=1 Tax=Novosphingobium sp. TaxID=1874826 RepID=UPI002FDF0E44
MSKTDTRAVRKPVITFGAGGAIGTLGGLIGLGGAEFRLPLLVGLFGFPALEAVILNKAMSLIVVATALPFRMGTVPVAEIAAHWPIIFNLLTGSLTGAWLGAAWATRLRAETLHRLIGILLVMIALVLIFGHGLRGGEALIADGWLRIATGILAGFAIGIVAALLGVAGGELLIPTLILLFGVDVKLAGSLSLAISLPTMIAGFARYSRDSSFAVIGQHRSFVTTMAVGSIVGSFLGGRLLGIVPESLLLPMLAGILILSAGKMLTHRKR